MRNRPIPFFLFGPLGHPEEQFVGAVTPWYWEYAPTATNGILAPWITMQNGSTNVTFTNYTGQDPEVANRFNGPFTILTDNSNTPPPFYLTFGITGSF